MCVSKPRAAWIVRLGPWTVHARTADEELHWALDREGRLLAGHDGPSHHRVGLDARVVTAAGDAPPRRVGIEAGDRVLAGAAAALRRAHAALAAGDADLEVEDPTARASARSLALSVLARAANRADHPGDERAAFARTYERGRLLPPDCAQALVVQVTEGCRWGRCTFCTLYEGVEHRVKDEAALEQHLDRVAALLGAGAPLRRRVFLGDANALLAPMPVLVKALDGARARFPDAARGGAHAFVDAFGGLRRTAQELQVLREHGLRRITVGLESGHEPLLRVLHKPATPAGVRDLVASAHRAGLDVGVTVLAGAGGRTFADEHVLDTARVVHELGLGPADLVFLSPLVGVAGGGALPLERDEVEDQADLLRDALEGGPWRVVPYDLRRSIL